MATPTSGILYHLYAPCADERDQGKRIFSGHEPANEAQPGRRFVEDGRNDVGRGLAFPEAFTGQRLGASNRISIWREAEPAYVAAVCCKIGNSNAKPLLRPDLSFYLAGRGFLDELGRERVLRESSAPHLDGAVALAGETLREFGIFLEP